MHSIFYSEITPADIRGSVATAGPLSFAAGVLISVSLGYKSCLGNEESWPVLLAFNGITGLMQAIILLLVPESPKYLIFNRKDTEAATNSLRMLRNGNQQDVENELKNILSASISNKNYIKLSIRITNYDLSLLIII